MIEKIEDWFVIIGFIWKICIIWYHLHHLRAIIKKLEFSVFWLCILKLFCWFLFRFVEMIADDWKDWRLICDNRIHLKDLYHLVSSASSTCDHQKSWSFLFFCCVFESCFVRFRFVLFRWLQMIKKIEDWFAIIFIWNIYIICIIIQKLKFSVFFLLYILELFCWFLFRFRWDDCWWLKRLKIDLW